MILNYTDSIGHGGIVNCICVCHTITFCHRFCHKVDSRHHNTNIRRVMNWMLDYGYFHYFAQEMLTFRLHTCLLQSFMRLHLASHWNDLLHGSSLVNRPQRHFFATISKHCPHSPRWQRSVHIWFPHFNVFWHVLPHGSISTVHGACVV